VSLDRCLPTSAEATLRARPAAAFATLNHRLITGFFIQEFAMDQPPSNDRAVAERALTRARENRKESRFIVLWLASV
jgi:hypothetical protein